MLLMNSQLLNYWCEMTCAYVKRRHESATIRAGARNCLTRLREMKPRKDSACTATPAATASHPAKQYECRAGLTRFNGRRALFVRSPRTGRRAIIPEQLYGSLPHRIPGRIAQATSRGILTVTFTREELVAIASASKIEGDSRGGDNRRHVFIPNSPGNLRYWGRPLPHAPRRIRMKVATAKANIDRGSLRNVVEEPNAIYH